jgi:hypothetical protein
MGHDPFGTPYTLSFTSLSDCTRPHNILSPDWMYSDSHQPSQPDFTHLNEKTIDIAVGSLKTCRYTLHETNVVVVRLGREHMEGYKNQSPSRQKRTSKKKPVYTSLHMRLFGLSIFVAVLTRQYGGEMEREL